MGLNHNRRRRRWRALEALCVLPVATVEVIPDFCVNFTGLIPEHCQRELAVGVCDSWSAHHLSLAALSFTLVWLHSLHCQPPIVHLDRDKTVGCL